MLRIHVTSNFDDSGSNTSNTPAFLTNLPSGARQTLSLQTPSAGNLNLVVTGAAATLTWLGTAGLRVLGGATTGRALTLRVGSRNTDATFAGTIAEQGTTGNTTSYVKTGSGTWTLSGTCNYNGGTTVEQGTLCVTGFLTSPQTANVLAGATLCVQTERSPWMR